MSTALHRVEVRVKPGSVDPRAASVQRRASAAGLSASSIACAKVYLIEAALGSDQVQQIARSLLADPVVEVAAVGVSSTTPSVCTVEVHPLPGVMDPAAQSVREGIRTLLGVDARVSTGVRYDFTGVSESSAATFAERALANTVVHQITKGPWTPAHLPQGHEYALSVRSIPIRDLSDEQLTKLSRDGHLFLSLDEMKAVQAEYRLLGREPRDIELETIAQTWSEHCVHKTLKSRIRYSEVEAPVPAAPASPQPIRHSAPVKRDDPYSFNFGFGETARSVTREPREPREVAEESDSDDVINWSDRPGHTIEPDGTIVIDNLLKRTVAAATFELIEEGVDWTLSVFKDNSGVIALDDEWGVCIKVETHNHPSALEPYGGSATGIGGCIRDVIGTGLGAKPIASTDVFCVAFPQAWSDVASADVRPLPPGTLHPRRILTDVVSGVRDYGNRMGIPTVNGAVMFADRFVGNPLVFCGCIGLIPRTHVKGEVKPGDRIIAIGGRTGRDGIHGATFSSAELESTHADEFGHAVQIGNAIEEKRTLDAILRARDIAGGPLYHGLTDCGAGGFSSAVGEMGKDIGAQVDLEKAPLKYSGLSYTEVWISEAQERMVLAVPEYNLPALRRICEEEGVEMADLGVFGTPNAELVLRYSGTEVGRLPMHFLHEGIPQPTREARWTPPAPPPQAKARSPHLGEALTSMLSHPSIASKHWIIRQYDHEVQGNTVVKPLVGPGGRGPGDAAVVEPISGSGRAIALACGLSVWNEPTAAAPYPGDPYLTTLAGIDECIRNLVCVGADPTRTAILDNFCWPSCEKPQNLASLVRAAEACYDGAKAYRTPFVSGKDSLNNQLRYTDPTTGEPIVIEIPPTLLVTGMAIVPNTARCITMDAKEAGNVLLLVGTTTTEMGGSCYAQRFACENLTFPLTHLQIGPQTARAVAQCIKDGLVQSAHDCSDGGLLVAIAEMLIATTGREAATTADVQGALSGLLSGGGQLPALGFSFTLEPDLLEKHELAFAETPSRYLLEVRPQDVNKIRTVLRDHGAITAAIVGTLNASGRLTWPQADLDSRVVDLAEAWLRPLAW